MGRPVKRDMLRRMAELNYIAFGMMNRLGLCLTRRYRTSMNHYLKRNLLDCTAGLLRIIPEMA